jgi:hypothetical protein
VPGPNPGVKAKPASAQARVSGGARAR